VAHLLALIESLSHPRRDWANSIAFWSSVGLSGRRHRSSVKACTQWSALVPCKVETIGSIARISQDSFSRYLVHDGDKQAPIFYRTRCVGEGAQLRQEFVDRDCIVRGKYNLVFISHFSQLSGVIKCNGTLAVTTAHGGLILNYGLDILVVYSIL
jgi:hypothetical protein